MFALAEPRKQHGGGVSKVNSDAVWTKRGRKAVFGWKQHVSLSTSDRAWYARPG